MKKFKLVVSLILVFSQISLAQLSTRSKKAEKWYHESEYLIKRRQYPEAVELLKQALDKDGEFIEAHLRIASIYKTLNYYPEAQHHYQQVISLASDPGKYIHAYYELADVYYQHGDYEKALENIQIFLQGFMGSNQQLKYQARQLEKNATYAMEQLKNPLNFNPQPLSNKINQFALQYFPVLTADQNTLFFTRRVGSSMQHDEDIYISKKDDQGNWSLPQSISPNINSQFNEGTNTISADGRTLIFTSCLGRKTYGSCDLFVSYKTGDQWSKPVNLGNRVNSRSWESQPSLSADGRTLFFVSDRGGGKGKRDIWISYRQEDGTWTEASNLGGQVNTGEDEVSPFIHVNGQTLFFASKGYQGMGGFDLYYTERQDNQWSEPKNLGFPINTHEDQVSLFVTADGQKGYYALDERQGGYLKGSKIYQFDIPKEIQVSTRSNYVTGMVYDSETKEKLKAEVELYDLRQDQKMSTVFSDSINGNYMMVLNEGSEYALYVNKKGYLFKSLSFNYEAGEKSKPVVVDVGLEPIKSGTVTTLENIFFDVDKYVLKEKSITELKKVVNFLNANPEIRVEIAGHTDNTGSASYNKELSLKRAEAVYDYLLEQGIETQRLIYKGYGQEVPKVPNDSDLNKSLNRRIEFRIL
ncbi:MAG: OmpA family protein [Candidatus Cyclobacteriaceae bacterium M3_2C_046]